MKESGVIQKVVQEHHKAVQAHLTLERAITEAAALHAANILLEENAQPEKKEKQTKKTALIRELLDSYTRIQKRIDNTEKRLACLDLTMGAPSIPKYSGMPGGSHEGSSKTERDVIKKAELEEKLADMNAEENRLREEIEGLIERMENPDEQTVIEMHYLDNAKWWPICEALYEDEPDYDENPQRYLKRTFKIHGSALQTLARLYEPEKGETP